MDLKNKLISLLTENARYTLKQLSSMTGADEKTVEKAIKEMEDSGVIVKYSAIIDGEKLSDNIVQALIEVKVTPQKLRGFDAFAEQITSFDEVKSLYLMSGGFDIAIFIEANTLAGVSRFVSEKLSTVEGVLSTATHFILKKYKIEGQPTVKNDGEGRQIIHA